MKAAVAGRMSAEIAMAATSVPKIIILVFFTVEHFLTPDGVVLGDKVAFAGSTQYPNTRQRFRKLDL